MTLFHCFLPIMVIAPLPFTENGCAAVTCFSALRKLPLEEQVHTALLDTHRMSHSHHPSHDDAPESEKMVTPGHQDVDLEQVDVRRLTQAQRQHLIEQALGTKDQDNEAFVKKMRERLDR